MMGRREALRRWVGIGARYGVVGVLGTLIHFATTIALVELLGTNPVAATVIGFLLALITSFVLMRGWVFRSAAPVAAAFPRYVAVSVAGLALNAGLMYLVVDIARVSYLWGLVAVVIVVPVFNFTLNRVWTFS
jgi:putative flippase GtrA